MLKVRWKDHHQEPRHGINPAYPAGRDCDLSYGRKRFCEGKLDYPAKGYGAWDISCRTCGVNALLTTTGRADDPRSFKLACRED